MYVPYVIDRPQPKDENSRTMAYLRVLDFAMKLRARRAKP
jgi:hypothetical protein